MKKWNGWKWKENYNERKGQKRERKRANEMKREGKKGNEREGNKPKEMKREGNKSKEMKTEGKSERIIQGKYTKKILALIFHPFRENCVGCQVFVQQ